MRMQIYAHKPSDLMPWKYIKVPEGEEPDIACGTIKGPFSTEYQAQEWVKEQENANAEKTS